MKIHMIDYNGNSKVPSWEENKLLGYVVCKCGYQRKTYTNDKNKVTCKHCIKLIGRN